MSFEESHLGRLRRHVGHDPLVSPGAQVLVLDEEERVLLMQRTDTGEWALPAGACEPGDSFRRTAVRELHEETGIAVEPAALVPFATISDPEVHTLRYPNGDVVHAYALCFWVRVPGSQILAGDGEASAYAWADLEQLPSPLFAVTAHAVGLYRGYLGSGLFQAD